MSAHPSRHLVGNSRVPHHLEGRHAAGCCRWRPTMQQRSSGASAASAAADQHQQQLRSQRSSRSELAMESPSCPGPGGVPALMALHRARLRAAVRAWRRAAAGRRRAARAAIRYRARYRPAVYIITNEYQCRLSIENWGFYRLVVCSL
jgi:hypothetical protein